MSDTREALFNRVASSIEGAPADDAVFALVFCLAECMYQITEGKYESEMPQEIQFLILSAYSSLCTTKDDTISIQ